jgi:hypothetical protein
MRTVVRSAVLIAFSVACGYAKLLLFPYLFFVEIFTVAVFLSGSLIGVAWGAWVGAVARLAFSLANPYGPTHPWVVAAQVVGCALVGAVGGLVRPWLFRDEGEAPLGARSRTVLLLVAGIAVTAIYDLITNVAHGLTIGSVPAALALALLPSAQHIASNAAIFVIVGNLAFPWLAHHPAVVRHAA